MGYELYYEGRITFDRPVSLDRPDAEELIHLTRFFTPVFEQAEGTSTGRSVTGFQVDEETAEGAKSLLWGEGFVAIEEFARSHQVTPTAQLRWQGDGCPADLADGRGHVVFDVHGDHHQVPDSNNNDKAVEAHRQRSCTCYPDPAPHPTPADPVVGPLTPVRNGHLTDYTAHCTDHGQIVFTPDENLARTLRNEHIAHHHG